MAEQIRTERLVIEALDGALADVHGRSFIPGSEVIDRLLDLRTIVDDIERVEAMARTTRIPERRPRFLRRHPQTHDAVPHRG